MREVACVSSQELAEAEDADHVASEAADLLYFAMVRCVAAGVGIAEIESHLDRSHLPPLSSPPTTSTSSTR